ncbi:putative pentatricopeptide repeat-containing protein At3g05240 [Typha latifolia]|uniref:putative pentatricopeptide repeat-containing protein At3g05240 n=1 Tax=Typha latifolia TaxID=4733 RepID=UPI003C2D6DBB
MRYLYFQPKPTLATYNNKWTKPHHQSIVALLQSCSEKSKLVQIHAQMIRTQLILDTFLVSRIVAFLTSPSTECNMGYARRVFDQIPHPNLFIWNSMVRGYTHNDSPEDGLFLYRLMLRRGISPDTYTYAVVTRACAQINNKQLGEAVHGMVRKCGFDLDMFVMSGLVNLYGSCGEIEIARELFAKMRQRDIVSWTSMLSGYAHSNRWDEVFVLLDDMKAEGFEPNKVTIMNLLSACGHWQAVERGQWIHTQVKKYGLESDVDIGNSLIRMYARCGCMPNALEAFTNMPVRNTMAWNSLIGGFVQNGLHREALTMFQEMASSDAMPDEITLVSALSASAHLGDLQQGNFLHTYIKDLDIVCDTFLGNSLINMYAKCGDLATAESIFHGMTEKDVVSWTAMICGYVQGNQCMEALNLFEEMKLLNVEANEITLVSLLSACSQLGALDRGREIHAYIEERNVYKDVCLGNTLVDMYAKCGCIEIASKIFHGMPQKDTHSWNAMIGGLATHGHGKKAIDLFNQMQRLGDVKPDSVTLTVILCACVHAGMVSEGFYYFGSMSTLYAVFPELEHYGCMVDLLSRAGLIEEAFDFIKKMPLEPNSVIWGSLLAACRVHRNIELGERILQHTIKVADDDGAHVLISNLYAETGRWDDIGRVRTLTRNKGMEKSPGCSSIEVDGIVHEFLVGDGIVHEHDTMFSCLMALHLT